MEQIERAALSSAVLRLNALHDKPGTDDRYRSGLRVAARELQALIRGDEDPLIPPTGRNRVYLSAEILFEGDYYEPGEMVGVCKDWVEGTLEDRDNVRGVEIQGIVRAVR